MDSPKQRYTASIPGGVGFLLLDGREHEDRDLPRGPCLVARVVLPDGAGALPPQVALGAGDLARGVVALDRAVLQLHLRVGDHVVVPDRVLRRPAHGGDDGVLAVVLDAHQGRLAKPAGLGADRGEHDDRHAVQRVGLGAPGGLESVDLVACAVGRAGCVLTGEGHVGATAWGRSAFPRTVDEGVLGTAPTALTGTNTVAQARGGPSG